MAVSLTKTAVLPALAVLSREAPVSIPLPIPGLSALFLFLSFEIYPSENIAPSEPELEEELDEELEDEADEEEDADRRFGVGGGLILDCADTGIENATLGDLRVSKLGTFELDSSCFDGGLLGSGWSTSNSLYISK